MKLLHIGLGKCGSTFLQKEIFPEIEKKININFIRFYNNDFFNIKKKEIMYGEFEKSKNIERLLPNNFIISNEGLFSRLWEFSRIQKNFQYIKDNFSYDTVILIIIRNPYDLLNSIYCHSVQNMRIVKPENFFYVDEKETKIRVKDKFNLYNFDYTKLITLYKSYFKKVVVVKYENLQNLQFLKDIFNLDNEFINDLKKKKDIFHNKTISKSGINFILFLNNFFDVKKSQILIRKFIKPTDNRIMNIKNKILFQFLLREFFQNKFDKFLPYSKYKIKKKYIPIDIDSEIKKYYLL
tara:strand:- start:1964 stop:2848 length:885 start_codon:yes stop_codon:yes gene_type:complete